MGFVTDFFDTPGIGCFATTTAFYKLWTMVSDELIPGTSQSLDLEFVDHIVILVADLDRTKRFYTALLRTPPHGTSDGVMYQVGETRLFFAVSEQSQTDAYDKERVGLNHLAFGVRRLEELQCICGQLDGAGIRHSGIRMDRYGEREFVWLDDPDGMRIEFYLRPPGFPG